jgi:hypothetical protein
MTSSTKETSKSKEVKDSKYTNEFCLDQYKKVKEWIASNYTRKKDEWAANIKATYDFDQKVADTYNNVFIPKVYEILWNAIPRLVGNNPRFAVKAEIGSEEVDEKNEASLKEFIEKSEWKRSRMRPITREMVQQLGVHGTGFMCIEWGDKPFFVWDRKEKKRVKKGSIGINTPSVPDIHDVYFDYRYSHIQNSPFCLIYKRNVSKRQMEELGFDVSNVTDEAVSKTNDKDLSNAYTTEKKDQMGLGDNNSVLKNTHTLEYLYTKDGDEVSKLCVICDGITVVYNDDNPFPHGKYPIVKANYQEKVNEGYGIGIAKMCTAIQTMYNKISNLRIDNVILAIFKRYIVDLSEGQIDVEQFLDMSNRVIKGKNAKDCIVPIEISNVTNNSYNETQSLDTNLQTLSGINNFTQDAATGFNDTATGTQILNKVASVRLEAVLTNIETALAEAGEMIVWNNIAFQENETIRNATGNEAFKLDDFSFPFTITVEPGSTSIEMNAKEQQEAALFLNVLTPFIQMGLIKPKPVLEKFFASYKEMEADKFFNEEGQQGATAQGATQPGQPPVEGEAEGPGQDPALLKMLLQDVPSGDVEFDPETQDSAAILETFKFIAEKMGEEFSSLPPDVKSKITQFVAAHQNLLQTNTNTNVEQGSGQLPAGEADVGATAPF